MNLFLKLLKWLSSLSRRRLNTTGLYELKKRHFAFKELLHANNEALHALADLESGRSDPGSVTMDDLRSHAVALTVNVFSIIRNLETVAGRPYPTLRQTLERRVLAMEKKLFLARRVEAESFAVSLSGISQEMGDVVGSKTANLAVMKNRLNLTVPDGFVLTTKAYKSFCAHNRLDEHIQKLMGDMDPRDPESVKDTSRRARECILAGTFPQDLEDAFREAYRALAERCGGPPRLAVRSSAIGEDSVSSSFAGLYESYLNIDEDNLLHAYRKVLAGKYTTQAVFYKANKGFQHGEIPMCVCCLQMVDAVVSGVLYTQDPIHPERTYISAGWGLGQGIVDGEVLPETFILNKKTGRIEERKISGQSMMVISEPSGGTREVPVPRVHADEVCLTDSDLAELFRVARVLEKHYRGPQDVEFALDEDGRLHILQTRALECGKAEGPQTREPEEVPPDALLLRCDEAEVACVGAGAGVAHVVADSRDMARFPPAGVLVVRTLMPEWMELLGRVKAVVAEMGSPTGHMASIAREFSVPMLVNVKGATRNIPEGELVTVDASGRALYRGRVESLLERYRQSSQRVLESPIYKTMEAVLGGVAPLNLTNPRDRNFRPAGCRTLHDIMRFCHEESINAMFAFNDTQTLRKGEVYRLAIPVPLRILVVDLGLGLREVRPGTREIPAGQVVSVPLLALMEGMTTPGVRWAGHVPLGFKSMVSVFANTLYDPLKHERELGARSYALVSRNYVNFSSRLGYHFSTLDAYCGDEPNSNYISFRFKGGAASVEKRARRAEFIARVLVAHDFWMDQKEDLVNANFKNFPAGETLDRLIMLGRLMGCARQLDVAMESPDHVAYFVDLFLKGQYNFFASPANS